MSRTRDTVVPDTACSRDKLVHLGRHDGEYLSGLRVNGGRGMGGSGRGRHEVTRLENPPCVADEHLKATPEYAERLVGSVVHVRSCLVTGVVLQVPSPDREVIHADNLSDVS
jgi:hypothetical protein